ncbi:hypothetical protein FACS189443_6560 [Planctomycetales bacterium]|nr:hypothetical protein FACS189443_6560 [Planctomycetales bacterium]
MTYSAMLHNLAETVCDRDLCIEAGMNDYCSKPIRAETLFAVIKRLAEVKRQ